MALVQGTRDKLTSVGTARIVAALAKHGLRRQSLSGLRPLSPFQDALIGGAAISIDTCPPGGVLLMESSVTSAPVALLARRKVAGIVSNSPLRNAAAMARAGLPAWQRPSGPPPKPLPIQPGDVLFGDRAGLIVIPADRADQIAEEAVEAMAYEEFVAEQVSFGRRRLRPAHPERRARPPRLRRLAAHQGSLVIDDASTAVNSPWSRQKRTKARQAPTIAAPLSRLKSAIVLWSGARRPTSHITSTLRLHSRSSRSKSGPR